MAQVLGPSPSNMAEREALQHLRMLPPDWVVVTDVEWAVRFNGSPLRDGQADFVVLAPKFGVCVVEIKATREIRIQNGQWERKDNGRWRRWDKSPRTQAESNAEKLQVLLQRMNVSVTPRSVGWFVCFPRGRMAHSPPAEIHLGKDTVSLQRHILERIRTTGASTPGLTAQAALEMGQRLLNAPMHMQPASVASEDLQRLESFIERYVEIWEGIFNVPRAAVIGPAGSGKTVLALARLRALIEAGRRSIYVVPNTMLSKILKLKNPDIKDFITTCDSLFTRILKQRARRYLQPHEKSKYFNEDLPGLVLDALGEDAIERFDDVIVDEGQDMGPYRRMALEELVRPDGSFLYCADENQDLYRRGGNERPVEVDAAFNLKYNCRNTLRINEVANRVRNEFWEMLEGRPVGQTPQIEVIEDDAAHARRAIDAAAAFLREGLRVAILSPYRLENSVLANHRQRKFVLTQDPAVWLQEKSVLFATVAAFKGSEADAVVVIDADVLDKSKAHDRKSLYVACTRGCARLVVLCKSAELQQLLQPS